MGEIPRITVDEVKRRQAGGERFTFIDTRSPSAWEASDRQIPDSLRILSSEIESQLARVPRGRPVVAWCT